MTQAQRGPVPKLEKTMLEANDNGVITFSDMSLEINGDDFIASVDGEGVVHIEEREVPDVVVCEARVIDQLMSFYKREHGITDQNSGGYMFGHDPNFLASGEDPKILYWRVKAREDFNEDLVIFMEHPYDVTKIIEVTMPATKAGSWKEETGLDRVSAAIEVSGYIAPEKEN